MLNIKLIACDIDGTLLDDSKTISSNMLDIINILKEKNIMFILTTGRNDIYVKGLAKKIGITTPIVACNGAFIREIFTKKVIYEQFLDSESVKKIIDYCLRNKYDFTLSSYDVMYCAYYSKRMNIFHEYNHKMEPEDKILIKKVYSVEDININKIFKIFLWRLSDEEKEKFYETFSDRDIIIVSSEKDGIDITLKDVKKGNAIKFLSDYYNISLDNIAVFGDNYNDISMLRLTKNSFSMGNAVDEVKRIANFEIESNNEDGVAKAIKKYILRL